jgi:LPS export ABC transporter protein LptC
VAPFFLISRKLSQFLVLLLFSSFILTVVGYLFFRGKAVNSSPNLTSLPRQSETPSSIVVLENFHRTESSNKPGKGWEIRAIKGLYNAGQQSIRLTDSVVRLTDKEGKPTTIKAKNAEVLFVGEAIGSVIAEGMVQITYSEGMILETQKAVYSKEDEVISSPVPVVVKGDRYTIHALSMSFQMNDKIASFKENVRSVFEPSRQ